MPAPAYEPVERRDRLVEVAMRALELSCPDSDVSLRGSLAAGTADAYSDIDLAWVVPDSQLLGCVDALGDVLQRVGEIASMRSDPDFQRSLRRRLIFVRFANVPLLWRLDLEVWAHSHAFDASCDADNPAARGEAWSLPESATMNAIGAVKTLRRGHPQAADGALRRGYDRIGAQDPGGAWATRINTLAGEAARQEPRLAPLAADVQTLVHELL